MVTYRHFTLEERTTIEEGLNQRESIISIAEHLGKSHSAVSREIIRNAVPVDTFGCHGERNRCCKKTDCTKQGLCPGMAYLCRKKLCNNCHKQNCNFACLDYEEEHCSLLSMASHVCNGCAKKPRCGLLKRGYSARAAQKKADLKLFESRRGMNFTEDEIREIDTVLSPLIKENGLSIHHIFVSHPELMTISERTAYKLVHAGKISARPIDTPRIVRFKRRETRPQVKVEKSCRIGRSIDDFNAFMAEHDLPVVEGDTVEGIRGGRCVLTLLFKQSDFQVGFLREHNDSASVTDIFWRLYCRLGPDMYQKLFPVLKLDNGTEFSAPSEIEKLGTRVFYCDPSAPYQKGSCERTHSDFRRIAPKGTSFNDLEQSFFDEAFSMVDSLVRPKFNDRTAYEMFSLQYGGLIDIQDIFSIRKVPADDVVLSAHLLRDYRDSHNTVIEGGNLHDEAE